MKGVVAGDTEFYFRRVDANNKMYIVSDMRITSNASEQENPEYKNVRLFDVTELNDYYKYSD